MNSFRLFASIAVVVLSQVQSVRGDILDDIAYERDNARIQQADLNTSLPSLTGNAEGSRRKMLDLDDRINFLLQEDDRRATARLNYDRINSLLNDLETAMCDAGARMLELDGFFYDSDIAASGYTAAECLEFAVQAKTGYENLSQGIQPWFSRAIEIRGKIASLELYLE